MLMVFLACSSHETGRKSQTPESEEAGVNYMKKAKISNWRDGDLGTSVGNGQG